MKILVKADSPATWKYCSWVNFSASVRLVTYTTIETYGLLVSVLLS